MAVGNAEREDGDGGVGRVKVSVLQKPGRKVTVGQEQAWLGLDLTAGEHTIKLMNVDGRGMDLYLIALVAMR